jgi:DNA-binding transcriptional ArsR family regulator
VSTVRPDDRTLDYEADEVLVVSQPEQMRALADGPRTKIVALLREHAQSTQELAEQLGLAKGTVAHHLSVLEHAGLIRVVRTRKVRALTERYYGRVARLFVFMGEDPADTRAVGAAALHEAADELARAHEGAHFGLIHARIAPEDARRFARRLARLVEDFRAADVPDGVPFALVNGLWNTESDDA